MKRLAPSPESVLGLAGERAERPPTGRCATTGRISSVMGMHTPHPSYSGTAHTPSRPPLSWAAAFGLGALVLLWPLTTLTGVAEVIGPLVRAVGVIAVIGAAWIAVVGLGGLARPVLTLTLTGLAGGLYLVAAALIAGTASGALSLISAGFMVLDMLATGAFWGVLAGLAAAGVQKLRANR